MCSRRASNDEAGGSATHERGLANAWKEGPAKTGFKTQAGNI